MTIIAVFKTLDDALLYRHRLAMLNPHSYCMDVARSDHCASHGFPFIVLTSRWS